MKPLFLVPVLGLLLLMGCLPNPVSVSRDGTIALTLNKEGEYQLLHDESQQVYLTNANADFLTKLEGMDDCRFPVISPSGRFIVASSGKESSWDKLLLYDRKTSKQRVVYRVPKGRDDRGVEFAVWSPDDKKIAFFEGPYETFPSLKVYDVSRRELEVLSRRACPQAAWLPDSRRLLYLSFPSGRVEASGAPPFGGLKMRDVNTGKLKTLARQQLCPWSQIAVFPEGNTIVFPCVKWGHEGAIGPGGVTFPFVLRKELLPSTVKEAVEPQGAEAKEKQTPQPEGTGAKPEPQKAQRAPTEEKPKEEGFVFEEGQPFYPFSCAVSPDGTRIAYIRYIWVPDRAEPQVAEGGESRAEKPKEGEGEAEQSEKRDEQDKDPDGVEFCVVSADGTGAAAVARNVEKDDNVAQVLWLTNTRLLCVAGDTIIAVDADGSNPLDLTEAVKARFADQFRHEGETEEQPAAQESK